MYSRIQFDQPKLQLLYQLSWNQTHWRFILQRKIIRFYFTGNGYAFMMLYYFTLLYLHVHVMLMSWYRGIQRERQHNEVCRNLDQRKDTHTWHSVSGLHHFIIWQNVNNWRLFWIGRIVTINIVLLNNSITCPITLPAAD